MKKKDTQPKIDKLEQFCRALDQNKKIMKDLSEVLDIKCKPNQDIKCKPNQDIKCKPNQIAEHPVTISGKISNFNRPRNVPESLKKLLKIEEEIMPRSKVTKRLYQYFSTNEMYNDLGQVVPNTRIKKIFGLKDNETISLYHLQRLLDKVYE